MSKVHYADQRQFTKSEVFLVKRYLLELPNDQGLEDIMRPDYWRHVAEQIKRLSVVTVVGGKDDLDVDLRCMASGTGYCMMRVIRSAPREALIDTVAEGKRRVEYKPSFKWAIIGHDGGILFPGYDTRDDAQRALDALETEEAAA
jgi:hypothetical protein